MVGQIVGLLPGYEDDEDLDRMIVIADRGDPKMLADDLRLDRISRDKRIFVII